MSSSSDACLLQYVLWPNGVKERVEEVRSILDRVRRFVDFDGTIAGHGGVPKETIMGRPLAGFLGEEDYVVQTWNYEAAIRFFERDFPHLPKPLLILVPESLASGDDNSEFFIGKNFAALGVTDKLIIDDCLNCEIYAPGCLVVNPE